MQIVSNNKLVASQHRVVTNSETGRVSIGTFVSPTGDCVVEPAKGLVNGDTPAIFRAFKYQEFIDDFLSRKDPQMTFTLDDYNLQS